MRLRKTPFAVVVCLAGCLATSANAQTTPAPGTPNTGSTTTEAAPGAPPAFAPPPAATPQSAPVVQTPTPSEPVTSPHVSVSTGAANVATGGTKVHGTITDPDGALIPGATIQMTPAKGSGIKTVSGSDGTYSLTVAPGRYTLVVTEKGFASYSMTNLRIPAVASTTVDATLAVGETTQVINVEATTVQVSVDQDSNASSTILTGKDLDALSDDPDELSSELTALAGPSAGPNGGQIYVDGFTGGQLPPKSSIREIRINQNPFSAQFDKLGYGRIEVFTKPGTDQFHGSFQVNGNPSQFNTSNPLAAAGVYQPPYHTVFMFGSLSGPITKWASFNVGGSHRDIEDDAFTQATILAPSVGSMALCAPGNLTCVASQIQISTYNPQIRTDISPRIDLQLGDNNVLTTRFQFVQNDQINQGIGTFTLPSAAFNSSSSSFELQMSDTQTYGSHVINETRFEYERERTNSTPFNNNPTLNVSGYFTGGGYSGQRLSDHQDHFEGQNYTSIQLKKNFIRFGGRLRATREAQYPGAGTNGTLTYNSLANYQAGIVSQFSQTIVNAPVDFTVADLGLYAETDWKPKSNLTISYGARFETQNHLNDHHDIAPRASFAYGLGGSTKAPKTVIRGGFGMFYDRFSAGDVLNLRKENGVNETVTTISNPALGCGPTTLAACTGTPGTGATVFSADPNMRSPYILQFALGADQQMSRFGKLSLNYVHSLGVHALALQNSACNPSPTTGLCLNTSTLNNQYFSEGQFHENQFIANATVQTTKWLSIFGYYSLIYANGNNSGAAAYISQPGNIRADLGRTTFDVRSRYFLSGSVTLPHYIQFSPFVIGQSGNPYNVTTGIDNNGDKLYNDRPYLANGVAPNGTTIKSIAGCGTFAEPGSQPAGAQLAPINACTGPALFTLNFRLTKTWGFGGQRASSNQGTQSSHGSGGPPDGSSSSGGSSSGHSHSHSSSGGSSSHGDFMSSGSSTGQRFNLAAGLGVSNLFNNHDLANPIGTLTSPYFGTSTQLQGQPYTTSNAVRRISLQVSFNF